MSYNRNEIHDRNMANGASKHFNFAIIYNNLFGLRYKNINFHKFNFLEPNSFILIILTTIKYIFLSTQITNTTIKDIKQT